MIIAVMGQHLTLFDNTRSDEQALQQYLPVEHFSTGELLAMCLHYGIDTLWIMPDTKTSKHAREFPEMFLVPVAGWERAIQQRNNRAVMSIKAWGKGVATRRIVFTEHAYRFGLEKADDEMALLHTLILMHRKFQIPVELSPGATGRALMKKYCDPRWLEVARIDELPRITAKVTTYHRALTEREKKPGMYLHVFDKNCDYLAAGTGVSLGTGSPEHVDATEAARLYRERQPGLWRVTVVGGRLPSWAVDGWYWTPTLHRLIRRGVVVRHEEAWIWRQHHTILRPWSEALWGVLRGFKRGSMEWVMCKQFYTQGLGWFSLKEDKNHFRATPTDREDVFNRRDWLQMIIAHSQMVIDMKLLGIEQKYGITHVWTNRDEIGFISSNPDPITAIPGISPGYGLGEFKAKYGGGIPVTDELIDAFTCKHWQETHSHLLRLGNEAKKRTTEKLQRVLLESAVTDMIAAVEHGR